MATHAHEAQISLLNDRIVILDRNLVDAFPANEVFRAVSDILALVRDEMVADNEAVQLSDYCFNVCEALNAAIRDRNTDDLGESTRMALKDLVRIIREIEQTLRRGVGMTRVEYDRVKIEERKLEIRRIFGILETPDPSLTRSGDMGEPMGVNLPTTAMTSESALRRLIRRDFVLRELPSLIEDIFSCKEVHDAIRRLPTDDAQAFINVIDEVLDRPDLPLWTKVKCLQPLYRTCGHYALLPKPLVIPSCYDRTGFPLYKGGYADVWKGEHCGRQVAVKVMRIYSNSDLQKILGRFCKEVMTWKTLQHPNILPLIGVTVSEAHFAMVSEWMANGNVNEFVKETPDANRLKLLEDVARGLIYIHHRGMIHGDLKGANILVDQTGHARLADFGLLTIISDPANFLSSSSCTQGGTARWTSPELISPQRFGLKVRRPTISSDCYSLGMVIYEVISGKPPFYEDVELMACMKVLSGERPLREEGFADILWRILEKCWMSQLNDRPSVEDVLHCLEACSSPLPPPSPGMYNRIEVDLGFDGKGDDEEIGAPVTVCCNCQSAGARVQGSDPVGQPLCNACDTYYKQHGVNKPPSPRRRVTGKRLTTQKRPFSDRDEEPDRKNTKRIGTIRVEEGPVSPSPEPQFLGLPPHLPSKTPVCIGQLGSTAFVLYPVNYLNPGGEQPLDSEKEWAPVRLNYEHNTSRGIGQDTIYLRTPVSRGTLGETLVGETFGVIEQKVASVLGPMLGKGLIRLEAKVRKGLPNVPMLPLLLLVYTTKGNISIVSKYLWQRGLLLVHPTLPSDQIRVEGGHYLNPHDRPPGGFGSSGVLPEGQGGSHAQMIHSGWLGPSFAAPPRVRNFRIGPPPRDPAPP